MEAVTPVAAAGSLGRGDASLLDASGYVIARRQATVSSKVTGKVTELFIEEGQHVSAGQVLARLDASNANALLQQAAAQVDQAEAHLASARGDARHATLRDQRLQKLHAQGFLSDQAVDDSREASERAQAALVSAQRAVASARAGLEVARRSVDDTVIRAPFAGVITVKAAQPGEIVSPISGAGGFTRTGIGTIVDMESLEVEVDVAESFIGRVQAGMPARVRLNAYPDADLPAEVLAVVPTADRSKATVSVRVGLKAPDPRVVPEMGARVAFLRAPALPSQRGELAGLVVPQGAVTVEGPGRGVVYVIKAGRLERRAVRLGAARGERRVVLAGVMPGEQLAVSQEGKLSDGAKVRVTRNPGAAK